MFTDDDPANAGQITYRSPKSNDPTDRLNIPQPKKGDVVSTNKLDDHANVNMFKRLMGHYSRELEIQSDNRIEMGIDEDFYDNEQWTDVDKQTLIDRGQSPFVFNVIATTINWVLGTEKRGRTDYKILPRRKEGSKSAEAKSKILKYLSDVNMSNFHVSRAFKDAIVVGIGWLEAGVQDEDDGEPIYDRYESWRNILADSLATEMDFSDGRYQFRTKWVDSDIAKSLFPKRKGVIERSSSNSYDYLRSLDGTGDELMDSAEEEFSNVPYSGVDGGVYIRDRVRLIEAWFRKPAVDHYVIGGDFHGEIYDPLSEGHRDDVILGRAQVLPKTRMRMHVAIMCDAGLLFMSKSPYRHNRFPFTPIWCYRRGRNGLPYGMVRGMRDPQSDINKRISKAQYILSSSKTIMDEGAVDDLDEFAEEVARPDAIIVKKPGKSLDINVDRDLAPAHLDLMSRSVQMIQQQSGVTDENLGRTTNATSGKAIIARQDQGSLSTASIFDNLRMARQLHGEKMLSLTEQFMRHQKEFRITNMRGNPDYITVNDGLPENDIVRTKADYIISEDDFNATIRQNQVAELMDLFNALAGTAPQIVLASIDLLVEMMDVPQREEIVKRIRQITGAEDPDADPNNPDPESQQRQEAKAKEQQFQERMAMAELADKEASAAEKQAKATKTGAEVNKIQAEISRILSEVAGANVETQVRALEAAASIMGGKALAGVADTVLQEAGYQSQQQP